MPDNVIFSAIPAINFALHQNHVPVIRLISITNNTEQDWHNITVEVAADAEFAASWTQSVAFLAKRQTHEVKTIPLNISGNYLASLTEKVAGNFIVSLNRGEETIFRQAYPVEILAYDQWSGISLMPEMLAAFITPNHPEIPKVILRASAILQQWTGSPSFDEYQTRNPNRVRLQMAAIYEAIAELQLVYCSVPASFEQSGQRIRLADAIFSQRLANCLDLSLLYAACLEAVGLHAFIVMVKEHAFAGAWLINETFADTVNDDPSLISKRSADGINEIVVVEATCMIAGHQVSFDEAVRSADAKMADTENFIFFIDLKRARFSGIRPIPLRMLTPTGWQIQEPEVTIRENKLPEEIVAGPGVVNVSRIDVTKQRLWERKLLDLTLRNSLLNTRLTKSVIQFMTTNVAALEDALANGEEFQVLGRPTDWEKGERDSGLYQAVHFSDPVAELVKHELSHQRIRSYLPDAELNIALTNVYRSSRLSMEENGANTLYVGLGLLKWFETDLSEKARYAPILLIPVEIIRKTALRGYVIRGREEETIMNITLLEMIRHDFGITIGGLETLPRDGNGVDVRTVFSIIRQAVMAKKRWDVEEQALLGTFSFSKFILWNDIHNNAEELAKNKVVASLLSGKLEWPAEETVSVDEVMDHHLHPANVALPISTDSSQLQAIVSASKGRSFVLHGPPGTGKSQTITNMIANALYEGKRVLFVAAKKAALDVVESRLESIGIGPFCLELHSNKSRKSAVLEQLKEAAQVATRRPPENYQQEAQRLADLRNELNVYVEALHKKYPFGYSLFELFEKYSHLPGGEDKVWFNAAAIASLTSADLSRWDDLAADLQAAGTIIQHANNHPLAALKPPAYSNDIRQRAATALEAYQQGLSRFREQSDTVAGILKLTGAVVNRAQEDSLVKLSRLLLMMDDAPASIFRVDSPEHTMAQVTVLAQHGLLRDLLQSQLLDNFRKEVLAVPAAQWLGEWNLAVGKWWLPRWLKQRSLAKNLKAYSKAGVVEKAESPAILQRIIDFQQEQEHLDQATGLHGVLGFLWNSGEADWKKITAVCETFLLINRTAGALRTGAGLKDWRQQLSDEFSEGSKGYIDFHRQALEQYTAGFQQIQLLENELSALLGVDAPALPGAGDNWKEQLMGIVTNWSQHLHLLKDWFGWVTVKEKALQGGLQPVVTAFENGGVQSDELVLQYQRGLFKSAAEYIIESHPQLTVFNGAVFSDKIRRFRALSKQFEALTRQELYARLAARIPSFTQEASQSSEIGVLQRAIRSNGRGMSIRKLFDAISHLLPRLTPCMLMSPISVAQYFEAGGEKFDLVIFDEASQLPTCEAVGAIARGQNVVVVGDPKQMPPTNFFSTNNIDEDNLEKEDLESILDDCLALSMPSQYLLWHYRSKHESLIAFSNAKYYDNKLLTFPSTDDLSSKVQLVPVAGYYDKGKTRQNRAEADAIVEEIAFRLSDPVLRQKTIGVVTFSSVQQTLVEDLLTELFVSRPDLEKIAMGGEEPLFIKNLENVQGDERDVILFSVCYGPDQEGRVSLNFGPINREGGWRRLNVAVSRARYEMKVFSTLRSDQINLNRTGAEGVAGLKAFLAYAEKGKEVLPARAIASQQEHAGFEQLLAEEIRRSGYDVHTRIGCSDYKIDLAIVDRRNPGRYVLGLLTDGTNYYEANTSKDREIVQLEVLAMLGWKIYRVWSTEWWEHPERVKAGILEAITQAEAHAIPDASDHQASAIDYHAIAPDHHARAPGNETMNTGDDTMGPGDVTAATSNVVLAGQSSFIAYEACRVPMAYSASVEDFLLTQNHALVTAQILRVLEAESPISRNLLCKRVLTAWGISRMGSRLNSHFELLFDSAGLKPIKTGDNHYFWKNSHAPENYTEFRTSSNEGEKREAEDLPPDEVANAVKEVLRNQISLMQPDLVRETAKLFGFGRVGGNVEAAMVSGIARAIEKGHARWSGERIVYTSS
ncbi:DUF3320 domain-containing protein [Flavihumibacter petaseus]|uniref:DNA helicase n=1 Tax=Flavihumibacter petaseus NBRC 106054 TaxID=1220578 RepID=A0A0E9N4K8_9BACT|nr:DUF3320 domain-containing protein [Flavihumibacter petaseus]GAO44733.1 hypothetical protein FPE01S_03_07720 [Flavihumibacter petaseus NBRC 106054]